MLNTQDAILDAIWNEDIEGFPDKFRDENLKELFLKKIVLTLSAGVWTSIHQIVKMKIFKKQHQERRNCFEFTTSSNNNNHIDDHYNQYNKNFNEINNYCFYHNDNKKHHNYTKGDRTSNNYFVNSSNNIYDNTCGNNNSQSHYNNKSSYNIDNFKSNCFRIVLLLVWMLSLDWDIQMVDVLVRRV